MATANNTMGCSQCKKVQGMLKDWLEGTKLWARKPFDTSGNAYDWVLFIGFVLVSIFLWTRVINSILREI